jgi:RNA polymerase sigma factor (sigma-70 family)
MNSLSAGKNANMQRWAEVAGAEAPSPVAEPATAGDDTNLGDDNVRFANVVLPYLDDAYNLARWLAGNRADAEDIVQDACINAIRGIGKFANVNARAWVLTIVRNTAYGWLAKNRPAALVYVGDLTAVESNHAASFNSGINTTETALIARTNSVRLRKAIAALPISYRETMVLREVQGLDYREIAEVTQVPIGTVMSRLARGRRRLIAAIGRKPNHRPSWEPSRRTADFPDPAGSIQRPGAECERAHAVIPSSANCQGTGRC